jgi:hypothetical protein
VTKEHAMRNPVHTWRRQPRLVRFLLCHAALGFLLAAVFVGGLVASDVNGIGTVLLTAAGHWWPVAALWGLTGLTFAAVQMGAATMSLGDEAPRRGSRAPARALLAPVPVRARRR